MRARFAPDTGCVPSNSPFFIVGTERSGSNLLRAVLNAHPNLAIPHPPHILEQFAPLEPRYGDLSRDGNLRLLARDVLRLPRVHIHPWPFQPQLDSVVANAQPRDLFGVFAAIYDAYGAHTGKPRWGCKSTFMIRFTDRILNRFADARLLWLVRDPRDVALSSRDSISPCHPYFTAKVWKQQQDLGLALSKRLGPSTLLLVRYEDLLADPAKSLRQVCAFLGEEFHGAMLRYFETPDARHAATLCLDWQSVAGPILSSNAGKYKQASAGAGDPSLCRRVPPTGGAPRPGPVVRECALGASAARHLARRRPLSPNFLSGTASGWACPPGAQLAHWHPHSVSRRRPDLRRANRVFGAARPPSGEIRDRWRWCIFSAFKPTSG